MAESNNTPEEKEKEWSKFPDEIKVTQTETNDQRVQEQLRREIYQQLRPWFEEDVKGQKTIMLDSAPDFNINAIQLELYKMGINLVYDQSFRLYVAAEETPAGFISAAKITKPAHMLYHYVAIPVVPGVIPPCYTPVVRSNNPRFVD